MEKQADVLGYVGLGVTTVGAVVSAVMGNVVPLSVGATIGVGCNVFSRKQYHETLVDSFNRQEKTIDDLMAKLEENHQELSNSLVSFKADFGNQLDNAKTKLNDSIIDVNDKLSAEVGRIDAQAKSINEVVNNLQQVENLSQELRVKPESASFLFARANSHYRLGNLAGAIADYTEAINKDPRYAEAYHKRGILYLETGTKQKAVDDLRKASLLYFEKGEIDSYRQAREMSRNIHQLHSNGNGVHQEMVVGVELFAN
ncbi:MAG: tetratricopeptide repeat protein [Cyanobacterium sp. T60_A2020_053]|nr:tetratricopeptide repeat protein [Cyanobacterium sp. T60_A2020_053]